MQSNKKILYWCFWFFFGNAILFWLIGLNYLPTVSLVDTSYLDLPHRILLKTFNALAYIGYLGLAAFIPFIILFPLIFITKRKLFFSIKIFVATFFALLLVVDVVTYKLYRFHLNSMILNLAVNGMHQSIWEMSWIEGFILAGILCGLFVIELLFAIGLWRYIVNKQSSKKLAIGILSVIGLSLCVSYGMMFITSGSTLNHVLSDEARFLPYYKIAPSFVLPPHKGNIALNRIEENAFNQPVKDQRPLNYPTQQTQCLQQPKPKNLVIIVIDTWRFDMLNPFVTPTLAAFTQKSWVFKNHFSGGNSTAPGIFSLFYGLPASYWPSMEAQHRGPVLLDELMKQHYQMGIFASATLKFPAFNKTVFSNVPHLRLESTGASPYDRDQTITREFTQFIKQASTQPQPFFGFLFYDAAHGYCAFNEDLKPFTPAIDNCNHMKLSNTSDPLPYLNRYKNALLLIDQQIKQVLTSLEDNHLLNDTVIVITGDHGEEFNDNHLGFWGHASNFTRYQVQTPLIIYWPHQPPKTLTYQTTHFDIAPTLMQWILGCQATPKSYSIGKNLLKPNQRDYLIVGSYTGLGIIEKDRITNISSLGDFNIEQLNGHSFDQANLNSDVLDSVIHDLRYFYRA